ncbi:hypothetical protein [Solirubrum puertoriconensis]|uniref:Lipoprotein n=1 Tax=Solirubrum puertoriconensis TaxID=1751427 RepID=A0A9X0HKR9_SOLP1|nr:hypothetical protein [Solirubrum puertoriconensis]KUG07740.1 hypothetical protein ASU33_15600 [Solirubrum puertoriconensis]
MLRVIFIAATLLLAACAGRIGGPGLGADAVEIQVQAQAASAYNIAWLRATISNRGTRPIRLLQLPDTIETACAPSANLTVRGLTPKADTAAVCRRCPAPGSATRYVVLRPGQQLTTNFQIDFNRVLPRAVADTLGQCLRYNNRTLGEYRFWVQYQPVGNIHPATNSNIVSVYRKQ